MITCGFPRAGAGLRLRTECGEQLPGGWVRPVPLREVGADVAGGLGGDLEIAHVGTAGEGEAGDESDADPGADQGAHEAVVAGAAGDARLEAADRSEHLQDAADVAPPVDPAFAGELGQADGPASQRVARGNQQAEVVGDERGVGAGPGRGRPGAGRRRSVEVVDEREISLAVADRTQRLIGLGLDHRDLHRLTVDGGQRGHEQRLAGAGKRDHGQGLRSVSLQGAQLLCGYLQLGVDRVGGGEQDPAGVGEGDAPRAAVHEHGARASFEGGDLLGHRRRRVAQRGGRPGEAARARDLPQHGQTMRVDQQFS